MGSLLDGKSIGGRAAHSAWPTLNLTDSSEGTLLACFLESILASVSFHFAFCALFSHTHIFVFWKCKIANDAGVVVVHHRQCSWFSVALLIAALL